ncbi:TRAP transporter small permease [Salinisphaera aquimarina]|uniref:TRAP transporter small permease protein n=1 Tax=Salinisphaera aquimarina TaxID=2094031 RepID=A0ABV7EML3_9GAMM
MTLFLLGLKQFCALLIVALISLLGANVFMRYALGSPLFSTAEISHLLMVWLSFVGIAVAAAERRHMAMDLVDSLLPAHYARRLSIAISVVVVITSIYVVYSGVRLALFNQSLYSEQLQISYAFFYGAIPVGFFCYLLFELRHLVDLLAGRDAPATQP